MLKETFSLRMFINIKQGCFSKVILFRIEIAVSFYY